MRSRWLEWLKGQMNFSSLVVDTVQCCCDFDVLHSRISRWHIQLVIAPTLYHCLLQMNALTKFTNVTILPNVKTPLEITHASVLMATCHNGRTASVRKRAYTAVSRKVVEKSARDNPERYFGWFCLPCSSKKFERMAQEATDICSQVLVEISKSRFDSYSR